jgi:hypothetical protein
MQSKDADADTMISSVKVLLKTLVYKLRLNVAKDK